ncbi:MAG: HAD family hydrolase [Thermoguttaceae bacterium]|jgi:pseudouridine-5'-monophosphatase
MTPKLLGAAFDMDGLMFETESVYHKDAEILLGRRGFPYTDELCLDVMGRPPQYCFEKFIETYNLPETWQSLSDESEEIFLELLKEGYDTMPGLEALLDRLETCGVPKCVATSSSRRITEAILAKDNLKSRFRFVITSDDIVHGKPDPQIYRIAADRFGIRPENLAVFEDSRAGIQAAKSAGATCFALRAEHNREVDLLEADLVVETLADPRILTRFESI